MFSYPISLPPPPEEYRYLVCLLIFPSMGSYWYMAHWKHSTYLLNEEKQFNHHPQLLNPVLGREAGMLLFHSLTISKSCTLGQAYSFSFLLNWEEGIKETNRIRDCYFYSLSLVFMRLGKNKPRSRSFSCNTSCGFLRKRAHRPHPLLTRNLR